LLLRTLASSSGGNCILVQEQDTSILIDAGISCKKITTRLEEAGVDPAGLGAILLTHEHSDHIAGLGVLMKRYPTPIYTTEGTGRALLQKRPELAPLLRTVPIEERFAIGALEVYAFRTPHDAAESVGYRCFAGGRSLSVLTDLGWVPDNVRAAVAGVDLALVEANHDEDWVRTGRYSPMLQSRILSDRGHLSNEAGGALGAYLTQQGAKTLVLGHLSKENNTPEHARQVVERVLAERNLHPRLEVAPCDALSQPFCL
jgi:phosphoribosyl 1,2-cyclic phosphodiesterase